MSTITVSNPIFDRVYLLQAWEDNNRTLKLVQGEGIAIPEEATEIMVSRVKCPRFQLRDKQGVINLSSGNPEITWAIKRPQGGEDLLACNIISGQDGIIEIPITVSATQFAGDVYGEIRVTTDNSIIKFFGVNACVGEGVSNETAARSSRFTALTEALQQVVALKNNNASITIEIPEGEEVPEEIVLSLIAAMSDLDENGDLRTGTDGSNPVSSNNLDIYLKNRFQTYLGDRFVDCKYVHKAHSSGYNATTNPIDDYDDAPFDGVYIDDAKEMGVLYIIRETDGATTGFILCAAAPGTTSSDVTQIALYYTGAFEYRCYHGSTSAWDTQWTSIETRANMDTSDGSLSNSDSKYASSKLIRSLLATKVDKRTTIAGLDLSSSITAESLIANLLATGKSINYVYESSPLDPLGTYGITDDLPVPTLLNVNGKLYLLLSKQQTGNTYKYDGCIIPQYSYIDQYSQFDVSSTIGKTGQIVVHGETAWICKGGTQWVCLNKPIVWDAATSASNDYMVPYDYEGDLGDRIQIVNADGEPELWELQRIWEDEKDGTRYTWAPVTNLHYVEDAIGATEARMRQITASFEVTLDKTKWVSHAQTFQAPNSFILDGELMTDITVSPTAFTQLQNDGCTGLFTTYEINDHILYVTVTCTGSDPISQDVAIRIVLINTTNMDEDISGGES